MLISVLLAVAILAEPDPDGVVATAPATPVLLDAAAAPEPASPEAAAHAQARDPSAMTTDQQIADWIAARDPDRSTWADEDMGPLDDRKVHGQVSAGVGTGGYRQYGATVSVPVGDTGRLDLSYSQTENAPWRPYDGYGYGYGYGYGPNRFDPAGELDGPSRDSRSLGFRFESGGRSDHRDSRPEERWRDR
jgi:hypothetical protein